MYAVIRSGGKQYRVSVGEKVRVEQLVAQVGSEVVLSDVLLVAEGEQVTVGAPLVQGARVTATVLAHGKGDKVRIFKMRRRKHYRKTLGHRQPFTELRIETVSV